MTLVPASVSEENLDLHSDLLPFRLPSLPPLSLPLSFLTSLLSSPFFLSSLPPSFLFQIKEAYLAIPLTR